MIDKKVILVVQTKNISGETMKKAEIEITEDQMRNQGFIQELLEQLGRLTDTEMVYDFKEKPLKYFAAHINIIEYGNPKNVLNELRFIVKGNSVEEVKSHVYLDLEKIIGKKNQEVEHVLYTEIDEFVANDVLRLHISTLFDETDFFI